MKIMHENNMIYGEFKENNLYYENEKIISSDFGTSSKVF